jgi:hypothetical protein
MYQALRPKAVAIGGGKGMTYLVALLKNHEVLAVASWRIRHVKAPHKRRTLGLSKTEHW